MPTVNTFFQDESYVAHLEAMTPGLKDLVAKELTCGDRKLDSREVTVRLIHSTGKGMMTDVEMDITAAPYKERIDRQDEICLTVREFVLDHIGGLEDAQVWLNLNELGHSQE
jgi:hypothetical protein